MLIVGSPVSPYVRKILAILHLKGLNYELDPITPFYGNDEFSKLSPLRRIPVLIDGDLVVNDSTVIAEYLEEAYPDVPVLPKGARERAQSRWIELLPCGLVHPNVLRASGVDPDEWSGFAFGLGLSRLVMLRFGISDVRLLLSGDLRFLEQF